MSTRKHRRRRLSAPADMPVPGQGGEPGRGDMEAAAMAGERPIGRDAGSSAPHGRQKAASRGKAAIDGQAAMLLAVLTLFNSANAFSGTFVPVYLFKAGHNYSLVGMYSLLQYLCGGICVWLAGAWVKQKGLVLSLRTGVALSGIFYLSVLLLGGAARSYAAPLGMLNGIAGGFFWLAYNVLYFEITEKDNRDRFNGWAGLLGSGVGMFAPWLSGIIIAARGGDAGYAVIFGLSLALFVLAAVISAKLKKRPPQGRYQWFMAIRELRDPSSPWRRFVPAILFQGLRDGVFMFLIGLTVYAATQREKQLGSFYLVTSLVALVSFWICGKLLRPSRRSAAMLAGTLAMTAVIVPLLAGVKYSTLLLLGIGTSLFAPLYMIPMTSAVFDLIGRSEDSARRRVEYTVLREASLTVGRVAGVGAFLVVASGGTPSPDRLAWLLLILGSAPIAGWWFIRRSLKVQGQTATAAGERRP